MAVQAYTVRVSKEQHMAAENSSSPQKTSGYGKRPAWQWVLIYIVVAAVVYGLVYYFFFRDSGGSGSSGGGLY